MSYTISTIRKSSLYPVLVGKVIQLIISRISSLVTLKLVSDRTHQVANLGFCCLISLPPSHSFTLTRKCSPFRGKCSPIREKFRPSEEEGGKERDMTCLWSESHHNKEAEKEDLEISMIVKFSNI